MNYPMLESFIGHHNAEWNHDDFSIPASRVVSFLGNKNVAVPR